MLLSNLQLSGKLNSYLADIDRQAEEMFERSVKQTTESEGVTEQLKAADQMLYGCSRQGVTPENFMQQI